MVSRLQIMLGKASMKSSRMGPARMQYLCTVQPIYQNNCLGFSFLDYDCLQTNTPRMRFEQRDGNPQSFSMFCRYTVCTY